MKLLDFFNPVSYNRYRHNTLAYEDMLSSQIQVASDNLDLSSCDVAIIGIEDATNSPNNKGCEKSPLAVRSNLNTLAKTTRPLKIVDLGNVRGLTINDRYFALQEVTRELFKYNITILFLGGGQDYIIPFCKVIEEKEKVILSLIDNKIDYSFDKSNFSSETSISQLESVINKDKLNISTLGVQKYFVGQSQIDYFDNNLWNILRLKDVQGERASNAEPIIRDSNIVCCDAAAIISSIMPYWNASNINGLSGVDACKLSWYSGMSSKIKVYGLTELNTDIDKQGTGAMLYAQMVWHFLEGLCYNIREIPNDSANFKIYIVHLSEFSVDIRFYNSMLSGCWWIEVPVNNGNDIIACSENDYQLAKKGELPQKWWSNFEHN